MNAKGWNDYLNLIEKYYYTEIIVFLTSFFLLSIIIRYFSKKKFANLFLTYALGCILLFAGLSFKLIFIPMNDRLSTVIIECANTIFAIIELGVFLTFFFQIIYSQTAKKLLLLFSIGFIVSVIFFFATALDIGNNNTEIRKASLTVNILEFSIFLVAILFYYIELFTKPPTLDLARSPAFWISSGLFIYILASLPFLLIAEYLWVQNKQLFYLIFSLHYLSLSLLLLTISKAFLCEQPLTT